MHTNLATEKLVIIPPPPPRFTIGEWHLDNRVKYRVIDDQQQLVHRVITESKRLQEQTAESVKVNKNETNHYLEARIVDVNFQKEETEKIRKEVCLEIEALETYMERIIDAMRSIETDGLAICKKCIILREGRLGIDLVHDKVERELIKEVHVIEGAQILLQRTAEQTKEQIRRLRSTIYFMDRDLEDKESAIKIDKHNTLLNEGSLNLSTYHGGTPLDISNVTIEEWESVTTRNFEKASKEKNAGVSLRSYVDNLLKQIVEDLWNQYNDVNEAFNQRIRDIRDVKTKLETRHAETVRQVNELTRNITSLEKAIADKEGYMALAHTRLGNRAQRPGLELTKDIVEFKLVQEVHELNLNMVSLQQILNQAKASLRYILQTQIQMEEDINIKTNSLKIDDVDCMTLRQNMDYHSY